MVRKGVWDMRRILDRRYRMKDEMDDEGYCLR
jgi:hypothetical protein